MMTLVGIALRCRRRCGGSSTRVLVLLSSFSFAFFLFLMGEGRRRQDEARQDRTGQDGTGQDEAGQEDELSWRWTTGRPALRRRRRQAFEMSDLPWFFYLRTSLVLSDRWGWRALSAFLHCTFALVSLREKGWDAFTYDQKHGAGGVCGSWIVDCGPFAAC